MVCFLLWNYIRNCLWLKHLIHFILFVDFQCYAECVSSAPDSILSPCQISLSSYFLVDLRVHLFMTGLTSPLFMAMLEFWLLGDFSGCFFLLLLIQGSVHFKWSLYSYPFLEPVIPLELTSFMFIYTGQYFEHPESLWFLSSWVSFVLWLLEEVCGSWV